MKNFIENLISFFKKPQTEIHYAIYKGGRVKQSFRGRGEDVVYLLVKIMDDEKLRPLVGLAQNYILKERTGIDPKRLFEELIIPKIKQDLGTEEFAHLKKDEKRLVN